MKKIAFLSISLLLLLVLIPGCITAQTPAPASTPGSAVTPVNPASLPPVVTPPVIAQFSSNLNSDGSSTLSWNVTGKADMVSIDQSIGIVNASGTKVVSPATSTVYTLSATYAIGNTTNDIGTITKSVTAPASVSSTPFSH